MGREGRRVGGEGKRREDEVGVKIGSKKWIGIEMRGERRGQTSSGGSVGRGVLYTESSN